MLLLIRPRNAFSPSEWELSTSLTLTETPFMRRIANVCWMFREWRTVVDVNGRSYFVIINKTHTHTSHIAHCIAAIIWRNLVARHQVMEKMTVWHSHGERSSKESMRNGGSDFFYSSAFQLDAVNAHFNLIGFCADEQHLDVFALILNE